MSELERGRLAFRNPAKKEWIIEELNALISEWRTWQEEVAKLGKDRENPLDPRPANILVDGEDNLRKHRLLQSKTLEFLDQNIIGHGFIKARDGRGVDRTDLRLHYRVKHRLDELDDLRACLEYVGGQDVAMRPEQTIQTNALRLLQIMEEATRGSSMPVFLGDIPNLQMPEEEAKAAFNYLRGKGLIEPSNLAYAGRVSAVGHDALANARQAPDKTSPAFPSITYNYYMNVGTMTGVNVQQGTSQSQITSTQTITTRQFAEGVLKLVDQLERALPDLPAPVREQTTAALAELKVAAEDHAPDAGRLRRGLESLKHIMEHAAGHLVAVGALQLIAQLLHSAPAH